MPCSQPAFSVSPRQNISPSVGIGPPELGPRPLAGDPEDVHHPHREPQHRPQDRGQGGQTASGDPGRPHPGAAVRTPAPWSSPARPTGCPPPRSSAARVESRTTPASPLPCMGDDHYSSRAKAMTWISQPTAHVVAERPARRAIYTHPDPPVNSLAHPSRNFSQSSRRMAAPWDGRCDAKELIGYKAGDRHLSDRSGATQDLHPPRRPVTAITPGEPAAGRPRRDPPGGINPGPISAPRIERKSGAELLKSSVHVTEWPGCPPSDTGREFFVDSG